MKKVTLQDIANSLGISRTTVWKVFSGHEGVSDAMRDKILAKARELNYKGSEDALSNEEAVSEPSVNVAVAVCRPEDSIFWLNIIHQIAKELSFRNANLIYTYLPSAADEDYELPPSLTNGNIHGIVILNVYQECLIRQLSRLDMPKVFLDTVTSVHPNELNGDLILMENTNSIVQVTEHLVQQGKEHFGFIGDIHYALSNYERYDGFLRVLNRFSLPVEERFLLTRFADTNTYQEEIISFLDDLPCFPEVFICANDYIACMLIQQLQKRTLRIPEDIAVSGFDNSNENPLAEDLTTVQVFNQDIGRRLALQILFRIAHPEARSEIVYVTTQVIFRNSTHIR